MIIAEHNNAFCDVKLYGDKQILMEQLINIIKALSIRLNKDKITILEILECYFFLEKENKKNKTFRKLFKQFLKESETRRVEKESAWSGMEFCLQTKHKKKDTGLSIQDELYLYNKKSVFYIRIKTIQNVL